MTFDEAMTALEQKKLVRRIGWGPATSLFLVPAGEWAVASHLLVQSCTYGGFLAFRSPAGELHPFTPQPHDRTSTDWVVIGEEGKPAPQTISVDVFDTAEVKGF